MKKLVLTQIFLGMVGLAGLVVSAPVFADSTPTYTASLSTSGGVAVNVSSAGNGANVSSDTVNVVSTCPSGYTLSIAGPSNATLYLNGDSSSVSSISASSGTTSNPVPIVGSGYVNTWGYSTASNTTTNSNFIGLTNTPAILTTKNSASASGGDNISVYYGASVNSSTKPGVYMMAESSAGAGDNAIVYYLTTSQDCVSYMVHFSPTSTATGSSISGTGTMTDQRIFENTATNLTANGFTAPSGYEFLEWNTAQDGTGTSYADGASVTNLTTVGQTITLYAQWKEVCPSGYICYHADDSDVVGTMGQQTISSSATLKELLASNFSREGYGFAGWSDVEDYATNPNAYFYGPQETISFTAGTYTSPNNGLDLYAVWVASEGYFQDSSKVATLCGTGSGSLDTDPADGTVNLSSVSALTDQRDNETYAIAKLADGNCWMIENLRLEAAGTVGYNEIDPTVTNQSLAQGYGTSTAYGNFSGLANAESATFSTTTATANSLYYSGIQEGTASINIGANDYPAYRIPRYNNLNTPDSVSSRPQNPTSNVFSDDNTTTGMYSYGNYYTWSAGMANTIYYSGRNATDADGKTSDTVNTSICPSGWRLPYGNTTGNGATSGGFSYLDTQLGGTGASQSTSEASNRWRKFPNNFLYAGEFYGLSSTRGGAGYYLSSTAFQYDSYLGLSLVSSYVRPGNDNHSKSNGSSARCVRTSGS